MPTLDGKVKLKISPETQTGRMFRLRGKGVKSVRGGWATMRKVVVGTPVNLSSRQRTISRLEESMGKASSNCFESARQTALKSSRRFNELIA